ncbi:MAG: helix-turn-helix transcriptional regulator [Ruminococcaceae bacterium]|nr:helix-turn-helix transcriptional regulator [Oscillospiraceae bacterium]
MNIKIGEKIKQLRQRDGRKQEDLANALGVSPQAVSRWEANGGYPDMELIPAIANYFNISIDELFGYSTDRQEKLRSILDKADKLLNKQGDMTECVELLRAAAEEFPSEPQVLIKLGYALSMCGWQKYGAKAYTKDGSEYTHEDAEYNSKNIYWQEEIRIFEKVLTMDISSEDRDVIIMMLIMVYTSMGNTDKAKALASNQNSIITCRETLMPKATAAEERDKYQGEAIISLLTELRNVICDSVCTKISPSAKSEGVKLFVVLAHLYESIFSDGRCGIAHYHLCELYMHAAVYEARFNKNTDQAFEYFKKGFEHKKLYDSIRCTGEYEYSSPLVAKVTFPSANFPSVSPTFWKGWIEVLPEAFKESIRSDSRFAECFE